MPTIRPGDLPLASAVPEGLGLCRDTSGNIIWDSGGSLSKMTNSNSVQALIVAQCGNSISKQGKYGDNVALAYTLKSIVEFGNMLSGVFRRVRLTSGVTDPNSRCDVYGAYGYSGQTLDTINSDMVANWLNVWSAAGKTPDVVAGIGLLENDIAGGATTQQCINSLTAWIAAVRAQWPGVSITTHTPLPSYSYDTAPKVVVYQAMRDYIRSLHDGYSFVVFDGDGYESGSTPGTPAGTSGAGVYTDATVHPHARGVSILGRAAAIAWAAAFGTQRKIPNSLILSKNKSAAGTNAAAGTNLTGTKADSVTAAGSANATAIVFTAEQPGQLCSYQAGASGNNNAIDLSSFSFDQIAFPISASEAQPYAVVQIVSGASAFRCLSLGGRIQENGSGNGNFHYHMSDVADGTLAWNDAIFKDGDILYLRIPPSIATTVGPTITAITNYFIPRLKIAGGTVVFRVIEQGCYL